MANAVALASDALKQENSLIPAWTDAANTVVTQRGSTDINPKKFGRQSVRPSQERAVGEPSSGDEGGAGDKARSELRERRRR